MFKNIVIEFKQRLYAKQIEELFKIISQSGTYKRNYFVIKNGYAQLSNRWLYQFERTNSWNIEVMIFHLAET